MLKRAPPFSLKVFGAKTDRMSCTFRKKAPTERLTVSRLFQQMLFAWNSFNQCKLDIQDSVLCYKSVNRIAPNLSTCEQADIKDSINKSAYEVFDSSIMGRFSQGISFENSTKETYRRAFDRI